MTVTVRFAPSPTGLIHIGNVRSALHNWLFALQHGGRFVLRFDDTDRERSRVEYMEAIERDLRWLGVEPHRIVRQSDRDGIYAAAADRLKAMGRLYPCYETADELERRRKRQLARGLPPIYDRAALSLTDEDRVHLEAEGRHPHWRFRLDGRPVTWIDLVRGEQTVDTASLSDPVLIRADGTWLYTLPSVVDDIDLGITHVIRGEDHVTNTGAQIEIFEALGGPVPTFAHTNLIATTTGEALSKRLGSLSVASLREAGYEPMTVASLAVLIGTSDEIHPWPDLPGLAAHMDLAHVSGSTARFDPHELDVLNARLVHALDYAAVEDRLAALGVNAGAGVDPAVFWEVVRPNLTRVAEAADWWRIVVEGPDRSPAGREAADPAFLAEARRLLPPEPWDETTWAAWTKAVGIATGRKGRELFLPLRLALTGRDHGPELKRLLPLIGWRRTSARLP
ncbi:glutamate--tRNA ligase [Prosthecomicrobium sp. N25]|uniref:glutamate--tRNA ligase n=1 Tax=Prosthecomicrobium sp. N25 TaxID=3129254 RepID=UPI0030781A34